MPEKAILLLSRTRDAHGSGTALMKLTRMCNADMLSRTLALKHRSAKSNYPGPTAMDMALPLLSAGLKSLLAVLS